MKLLSKSKHCKSCLYIFVVLEISSKIQVLTHMKFSCTCFRGLFKFNRNWLGTKSIPTCFNPLQITTSPDNQYLEVTYVRAAIGQPWARP